jgi:hypothetical protein
LLFSIPALLACAVIVWAAAFKKSDRDLCLEILSSVVRSDDVVILAPSLAAGREQLTVQVRKVFLAETAHVSFLRGELRIEMNTEGKDRAYSEPSPRGRVVLAISGEQEATTIGRVVGVTVGSYRLLVVHPVDMQGGRWGLVPFLAGARVRRSGKEGEKTCPFRGGVFDCGGEPWMDVKIEHLPFAGVWHSCIFAHPLTDSMLSIEFAVPGPTSAVELSGGIDDSGVGYPLGTPVNVRLTSGEQELGSAVFPNTPGFPSRTVEFGRELAEGDPLTFHITTLNQDTRHFCFSGTGR